MKLYKSFKEFNLWMWNNPNPLGKINLILSYTIPILALIVFIYVEYLS
jgi:hypothetical protein